MDTSAMDTSAADTSAADMSAMETSSSTALDFEEECALLELACTQPDIKEEEDDELQPDEWAAVDELALLAAAEEAELLQAAAVQVKAEPLEDADDPWSNDEDRRLTALMLERRPTDSWTVIAVALGGDRSVTSCSARWNAIAGVHGDSIREGARRAARDFLEEAADGHGPRQQDEKAAADESSRAVNLRVLSTAAVSVVPFEVPPDDFGLLVGNLPRGIDQESLQHIFAPFGAVYEIQLRAAGGGGGGGTHAFVRYFSAHDAQQAFDALDGKYTHSAHGPSTYVRMKRIKRAKRDQARELWPLAPEKAAVLLQRYLPLGFSTNILELSLIAEDRVTQGDGSAGGSWFCRYQATVGLQLHQRKGAERDSAQGSAEGEHTDRSRGDARTVAMKRAKRLALQAAFSELVLVIDHVDNAAVVLFDDEL